MQHMGLFFLLFVITPLIVGIVLILLAGTFLFVDISLIKTE